ncbi:hypothetical protein AN915_26595 [Mycobacteroides immunogenum]|uniref:Uncharacterized protein n=1 Tax=Mycobacteroides immunogenum TaxID=83262 RepID=A0ABR5LKI9_9MYCO|nr:hypothetical protein AN912_25665 [Mycobacteroides immunogenum]KPG26310.1 hypothetical protein AN913_21350 [Mycobacteroides immunogenum]KPG31818.1 hypothetical protein AN914_25955 [Mycobacteroides immunogenum]KPG39705.1 hypothetical protein AN915_26595 [Mycobacteroides immunogenum]KPG57289.1 hypothetical protein AN918_26485 [Mycobacteroides immunogenum]
MPCFIGVATAYLDNSLHLGVMEKVQLGGADYECGRQNYCSVFVHGSGIEVVVSDLVQVQSPATVHLQEYLFAHALNYSQNCGKVAMSAAP